jgi:hypothetical protein
MQRSMVDFPDPDGPAMTTTSPRSIVRSMPSSTTLSLSWESVGRPVPVITG